jgi:hypothetical protein
MDADLVQAAGHGAALDQGGAHVFGEHAIGGFGLPAPGGRGDDGQFLVAGPLGLNFGDGLIDQTDVLVGRLVADGPVELADLAFLKVAAELVVGLGGQGYDEKA